jgi:hypothetical protein
VWIGGGEPDLAGYSRLPLGLWRRQWADLSVLSFQQQLLEQVTPEFQLEQALDPAQIRLFVGDLSQSQLAEGVQQWAAARTLDTSGQGARFLNRLAEQLRVSREQALASAELLLDGQIVCPMTDQPYQLLDLHDTHAAWGAPMGSDTTSFDTLETPLLGWFRGLYADVTRHAAGVLVRAELDMYRPRERGPQMNALPLFDFFKNRRPSTAPDRDQTPAAPAPDLDNSQTPRPAPDQPMDESDASRSVGREF